MKSDYEDNADGLIGQSINNDYQDYQDFAPDTSEDHDIASNESTKNTDQSKVKMKGKRRGKGRPAKHSSPGSAAAARLIIIQCPLCSKTFNNSSALAKHKLIHSDERKYTCAICSKAFKRQDHLNGHMMTHCTKKPYQCQLNDCDKSYCDSRSLRRHLEHHHQLAEFSDTSLTPNSLTPCLTPRSSDGVGGPMNVFRFDIIPCSTEMSEGSQTSDAQTTLKNTWITGYNPLNEPKPVQCTLCERRFRNMPALNGHMRLHGGFVKDSEIKSQDNSDVSFTTAVNSSHKESNVVEIQSVSKSEPVISPPKQKRHANSGSFIASTSQTASEFVNQLVHSPQDMMHSEGHVFVDEQKLTTKTKHLQLIDTFGEEAQCFDMPLLQLEQDYDNVNVQQHNLQQLKQDYRDDDNQQGADNAHFDTHHVGQNQFQLFNNINQVLPTQPEWVDCSPFVVQNIPDDALASQQLCCSTSNMQGVAKGYQQHDLPELNQLQQTTEEFICNHKGKIVGTAYDSLDDSQLIAQQDVQENTVDLLNRFKQEEHMKQESEYVNCVFDGLYVTGNNPNVILASHAVTTSGPDDSSSSDNSVLCNPTLHDDQNKTVMHIFHSKSQPALITNSQQSVTDHVKLHLPVSKTVHHQQQLLLSPFLVHSPYLRHTSKNRRISGECASAGLLHSQSSNIFQFPSREELCQPSLRSFALQAALTVQTPMSSQAQHLTPRPPHTPHSPYTPHKAPRTPHTPHTPSRLPGTPSHAFHFQFPPVIEDAQLQDTFGGSTPIAPTIHRNKMAYHPYAAQQPVASPHYLQQQQTQTQQQTQQQLSQLQQQKSREEFQRDVQQVDQMLNEHIQELQKRDLEQQLQQQHRLPQPEPHCSEQAAVLAVATDKIEKQQSSVVALNQDVSLNHDDMMLSISPDANCNVTNKMNQHQPNSFYDNSGNGQSAASTSDALLQFGMDIDTIDNFNQEALQNLMGDDDLQLLTEVIVNSGLYMSSTAEICPNERLDNVDAISGTRFQQQTTPTTRSDCSTTSNTTDLSSSYTSLTNDGTGIVVLNKMTISFPEDESNKTKSQNQTMLFKSCPCPVASQTSTSADYDTDAAPLSVPKKKKLKPEPLVIPSNVNHYRFPSMLRSPQLFNSGAATRRRKTLPPYTPPPMISPARSGSGTFWAMASYKIPPQSAPPCQTSEDTYYSFDKDWIAVQHDPPLVTDIVPHVNVGPEFQAEVPPIGVPSSEESNLQVVGTLIWDPKITDILGEKELTKYQDFACCASLPGNGTNREHALHLLHTCDGNTKAAMLKLVKGEGMIYEKDIKSDECDAWRQFEIEAYRAALLVRDKDFHYIAKEVGTKSVKQCIQFYYLWKKLCPEDYQRLCYMRKCNTQDPVDEMIASITDARDTIDQSSFHTSTTVVSSVRNDEMLR